MVRKFLRPFIRRHGFDLIRYPMPDWYLLRDGLAEIFSTLCINCVIDAGANRGQYGEFLRNMGYRNRLASFEPIPAVFKLPGRKEQERPRLACLQPRIGLIQSSARSQCDQQRGVQLSAPGEFVW